MCVIAAASRRVYSITVYWSCLIAHSIHLVISVTRHSYLAPLHTTSHWRITFVAFSNSVVSRVSVSPLLKSSLTRKLASYSPLQAADLSHHLLSLSRFPPVTPRRQNLKRERYHDLHPLLHISQQLNISLRGSLQLPPLPPLPSSAQKKPSQKPRQLTSYKSGETTLKSTRSK